MQELTYGPLNKSLFTQELELVAKCLIHQGDKINLALSRNETTNNNELHATIGDTDINLTSLFKKSNFSHLALNQSDSAKYLSNSSDYFYYQHANLTSAEIKAIKSYTGSSNPFNCLLYNTLNNYPSELVSILKYNFIDTCMLGSGLKKIMPNTSDLLPTYRGEYSTPEYEINERIKLINEGGGISESKAFLSTSLSPDIASDFSGGKCEIHFDAPYGKKIYDLSHFPGEEEFLLAPTQLQWESYEKIGNKYIFHAKVVEPLIEGKDEATPEDLDTFKKLVTWATEQGISTDFITGHLLNKIGSNASIPFEQDDINEDVFQEGVTPNAFETSPISLVDCISFDDLSPLALLQETQIDQSSPTSDLSMMDSKTIEPLAVNCAHLISPIENTPMLVEVMG